MVMAWRDSQGFGSPSTPQSRLNLQHIGLCSYNLPPKDDAKTVQWYEQHQEEEKPWCDFFVWYDDEFEPQAKAWLTRCWEKEQKMLEKEKTLMNEVLEVKKENLDLHKELYALKNSHFELEKKTTAFEGRALEKKFSWLNFRNYVVLCICILAYWFFF